MKFPPRCVETETGSVISRHEGTTFRLHNPHRVSVQVVHVDGCVITGREDKRCDYLFLPASPPQEIYVEFKGKSVEEGIKQIEATIHRLSVDRANAVKHCFLIPSQVRPQAKTKVQIAKDRFRQSYNARLTVKNHMAEHCLA